MKLTAAVSKPRDLIAGPSAHRLVNPFALSALSALAGVLALTAAGCASGSSPVATSGPAPTCANGAQMGGDGVLVGAAGGAAGFPVGPGAFMPQTAIASDLQGDAVQASEPPPPISGGTLLATHDGTTLVAADPDRDQVYVVDVAQNKLRATIPLQAGDEPGRLVEDAAGHVHVALRGGAAIATLDVVQGTSLARTSVCALPRGIAYDASNDALHVACASGELVTLTATTLAKQRSVMLERDLRDVMVTPSGLRVSTFRSAELLTLDAAGKVMSRTQPGLLPTTETLDECVGSLQMSLSSANVAWRTLAMPDGQVAMVHQRGKLGEIGTSPGGYASGGCSTGIVDSVVTLMDTQGEQRAFPGLTSLTLPVDMTVSPDGMHVAVVGAGNFGVAPQVQMYSSTSLQSLSVEKGKLSDLGKPLGNGAVGAGGTAGTGAPSVAAGSPSICSFPDASMDPAGQATAVTYVDNTLLAVQTRDPAAIYTYRFHADTAQSPTLMQPVMLSAMLRSDTGHTMFHMRQPAGIACASCHPEAGDDSHVWNFKDIGPRRTQHLRGGILGTEPFHWNGDMKTFGKLMTEVFVGRMAGTTPRGDQANALSHWIDRQPSLKVAPPEDKAAAVARGKHLFESSSVACASCHSGSHMTDNQTVDVGTGVALQVPSLRGVSFRAPFLHNGCAKTLVDRFGSCGGGDKHGHTSDLTSAQRSDLVTYLETL